MTKLEDLIRSSHDRPESQTTGIMHELICDVVNEVGRVTTLETTRRQVHGQPCGCDRRIGQIHVESCMLFAEKLLDVVDVELVISR